MRYVIVTTRKTTHMSTFVPRQSPLVVVYRITPITSMHHVTWARDQGNTVGGPDIAVAVLYRAVAKEWPLASKGVYSSVSSWVGHFLDHFINPIRNSRLYAHI